MTTNDDLLTRPITHLYQPNKWSCFATCAAMLLGETVEQIIEDIGHDGSEIIWPQFNDSRKYRGFNYQEILDVFIMRGYAFVPIEKDPISFSDIKCNHPYNVYYPEGNETRFNKYLKGRGILLLDIPKIGHHAVVFQEKKDWEYKVIYDPDKENPAKLYNIAAYFRMIKLKDDILIDFRQWVIDKLFQWQDDSSLEGTSKICRDCLKIDEHILHVAWGWNHIVFKADPNNEHPVTMGGKDWPNCYILKPGENVQIPRVSFNLNRESLLKNNQII